MRKQLLAIIIAAGVSGCATAPQVPQKSISEKCVDMGYTPGTEPFLHCIEVVSNHAARIQAIEQQEEAARIQSIDAYFSRQQIPMPVMPFQQPRINVYHYGY